MFVRETDRGLKIQYHKFYYSLYVSFTSFLFYPSYQNKHKFMWKQMLYQTRERNSFEIAYVTEINLNIIQNKWNKITTTAANFT